MKTALTYSTVPLTYQRESCPEWLPGKIIHQVREVLDGMSFLPSKIFLHHSVFPNLLSDRI